MRAEREKISGSVFSYSFFRTAFTGKLVSTGNTQTGKSENAVQVRNSSPSPNGLKIKYAYRMRQAVKEKESGKRKERHGAGNGKGNGNEKRQSCNGEKTDC